MNYNAIIFKNRFIPSSWNYFFRIASILERIYNYQEYKLHIYQKPLILLEY